MKFYSKHNLPSEMRVERSEKPIWAVEDHAEIVRVRPEFATTISQIMYKYAGGNNPRICDNGDVEVPIDSQKLTAEHVQAMFDSIDVMDANCIDINDYEQMALALNDVIKQRREHNQQMAANSVSESELTNIE